MFRVILRVVDQYDHVNRVPISEFYLTNSQRSISLEKTKTQGFLMCPVCKHHDWVDGVVMHRYECESCASEINVTVEDE